MAEFPLTLAKRLRAGETLFTLWSQIPSEGLIDHFGTSSFEAITLDMQHGGHNEQTVLDGLATIIRRNKCAIVRVPVGRNDMVSRALDMGAEAIISPMINSVEDAQAFADAMKYPPMGERSWGATRGVSVRGTQGGNALLESGNSDTVSFAMIETKQAYLALDDILAIEGIDGVFVGPSDFSISFTDGRQVDASLEEMMPAIEDIAVRARKAGKFAATLVLDPADAGRFVAFGYQLIALGLDTLVISAGANDFYTKAKKSCS